MESTRAILIAGPTASGKSALAVAVAARVGGVVVNADSMQVYRDLTVLTARPGPADLSRVRHALYGHVDGAEPYSVGRWLADVTTIVEELRRQGLAPVIVGGTGLYFKALIEGLAPIPPIPPEVRAHWRAEVGRRGPAALHAELGRRDPATAAGLRPSDPQRIVRALEVLEATGKSLSDWQRVPGRPLIDQTTAVKVVAAPSREALHARADTRLQAMMEAGALAEVERLAARRLARDLPVMRALGVPPLLAHLAGECDLEDAMTTTALDTNHYIKRQLTWLKRHMITWTWLSEQEIERNWRGDFTLIWH